MKKIIFLFLSISFLLSPSLVFGRSAADVILYHYRTTPHPNAQNNAPNDKVAPYSLFPQEEEIKGFPTPVSKNETDLAILHSYYEQVSAAYEKYLHMDLKPKLETYKVQILGQHQKIHLIKTRLENPKNQFSRDLIEGRGQTAGQDRIEQKARIQAIGYYGNSHKNLSEDLERTKEKILFYKELGKISEELYKGEIH